MAGVAWDQALLKAARRVEINEAGIESSALESDYCSSNPHRPGDGDAHDPFATEDICK